MNKVYISSTYVDLKEHRKQLYKILHNRKFDVVMQEQLTESSLYRVNNHPSGLPPDINGYLLEVLPRYEQFVNDDDLRRVFIDARIVPWRNSLPQAHNPNNRVKVVVDFLWDKYNKSQQNALVLFLQVLRDGIHPDDIRYNSLYELAKKLEDFIEESCLAKAVEERPLDQCLENVASCDIYIGIFAWHYGYIPSGQQFSITELEYRQARKSGLECLIFLSKEPSRVFNRGEQNTEKIKNLRKELEQIPNSYYFDDIESFVSRATSSIVSYIREESETSIPQILLQAPIPPSKYVERSQVKIIKTLLLNQQQAVSSIALHGMGGIGKTTIAVALAHDLVVQRFFKDGILWADLGPETSVEDWQIAWGTALGDNLRPYPTPITKAARLRSLLSDKHCLLIIDDIWSTNDFMHLMVGGANCRTLLITRQGTVIQVAGAEKISIDVMQEKESITLLEKWAERSLDTSRAKKLVGCLGYLPLAITLVGALLQYGITLDDLLKIFQEEEVDFTYFDLGDSETRENSLYLTFELSKQRLSDTDQIRFAQLGVFGSESFDINAVAAIWETNRKRIERTLRLFVHHALLNKTESGFSLHPLLSIYAFHLLSERGLQELSKTLTQHRDYYLSLAKRSVKDWRATETALGQIRIAWHRLDNAESEIIFEFVDSMTYFFDLKGLAEDSISWAEKGYILASKLREYDKAIQYLNIIGASYMQLGSLEQAEKYFSDAVKRAQEANDLLHHHAWTLQYLGSLYLSRGNLDYALTQYQQALTLAEQISAPLLISKVYNEIGEVYQARGSNEEAIEYYKKSLAIYPTSENSQGLATSYRNLGEAYLYKGDFLQAYSELHEALKWATEVGEEREIAKIHASLSNLYTQQGEYELANKEAEISLDIMLRIHDQKGIADIQIHIGDLLFEKREYLQAISRYEEALQIYERIGDNLGITKSYSNIGNICQALDNFGQSLVYYHKALKIARNFQDSPILANLYLRLGELYSKLGDMDQANSYYKSAKALSYAINDIQLVWLSVQGIDGLYKDDYNIPEFLDNFSVFSRKQNDTERLIQLWNNLNLSKKTSE